MNIKTDFEAALDQLQLTVKNLESGELSLEQSLKQFEEGVRLTRLCQEYLSSAEQRVDLLLKSNNSNSTTDSSAAHPEMELKPFSVGNARSSH